jgi:hypothetical protein
MAQSTSVNGNASLALYREDLPSGAITIMLRACVGSWSGGNASQVLFRVEGDSGQLLVTLERDAGTIVCNSGAFTNLSTGSYTGWGTLSLTWTGASGASAITVRWTPDGGSATTVSAASRGNLWGLYLFGLFWDSSTICNQARMCSVLVDTRLYSAAEITAQSLVDAPLEAVNAFYPMSAAGTVEVSTSGSGSNLIVGAGAGQTVSESPYPGTITADPGRADETDTALAVSASKRVTVGAGAETSTALARAASKSAATGLGAETATAHALTSSKRVAPGLAAESSAALASAAHKTRAVAVSAETDVATAPASPIQADVGTAIESSAALGLTAAKSRATGRANETDTARSPLAVANQGATRLRPPVVTAPQLLVIPTAPQLQVSVY